MSVSRPRSFGGRLLRAVLALEGLVSDTLAELLRFEDAPDTPAALAYHASRREEATVVAQALRLQIKTAIQQLEPAS